MPDAPLSADVTERAELEITLSELTEAQLAMLAQIFPRHGELAYAAYAYA